MLTMLTLNLKPAPAQPRRLKDAVETILLRLFEDSDFAGYVASVYHGSNGFVHSDDVMIARTVILDASSAMHPDQLVATANVRDVIRAIHVVMRRYNGPRSHRR